MVQKAQIRQRFKLPFRKSFPWTAQVTVDLPPQLGSERRVFHAKGEKTFEFLPIRDPERAALKLTDLRIALPETDIVLRRGKFNVTRPVRIPELTIGPDAIDFEGSSGFVELATGRFALQFTINLTPKIIPLLREYKIEKLPILVQEGGRLDLGEGNRYKSLFSVSVAPEYGGEFGFSCCGFKDDCPTRAEIGATLTEPDPLAYRSPGGTVLVCPGETVYLWWTISDDVTSASITPDVGDVYPNDLTGVKIVKPEKTTEYKILAKGEGECEDESSVRVHVIQPGDTFDIQASPISSSGSQVPFEYRMSVNECSENIKVTSMQPICCPNCFFEPAVGLLFLECDGYDCHGQWSLIKEDPDGHIHSLTPSLIRIDVAEIPWAGTWTFWPLGLSGWKPEGIACFRLWVKCKKPIIT